MWANNNYDRINGTGNSKSKEWEKSLNFHLQPAKSSTTTAIAKKKKEEQCKCTFKVK